MLVHTLNEYLVLLLRPSSSFRVPDDAAIPPITLIGVPFGEASSDSLPVQIVLACELLEKFVFFFVPKLPVDIADVSLEVRLGKR